MPLKAYYQSKGLDEAIHSSKHNAIFSTLLGEGKPISKSRLVSEVSRTFGPTAAVRGEINKLMSLGFLERTGLGKIRIAPAVASQPELHKLISNLGRHFATGKQS